MCPKMINIYSIFRMQNMTPSLAWHRISAPNVCRDNHNNEYKNVYWQAKKRLLYTYNYTVKCNETYK